MFTTFRGTSPQDAGQKDATRPKRGQVHRACDWCKLVRTKCDTHRPCNTCQQAGRECVTNGQNHFRSIAAATKEVERLRAQVQDLERRMEKMRSSKADATSRRSSLTDGHTELSPASPRGVRLDSVYYGTSSLAFFLKRMSSFLETSLHGPQPQLDIAFHSSGASTPSLFPSDTLAVQFPPRSQENYLLDLFWQTHHFRYPIIDEVDFRKHYQSLWSNLAPDTRRQSSPLVDIVLALCVQLGASTVHHDTGTPATQESRHPNLAGFQYYQRCWASLGETMESPSITTVQCSVFSVVYLYEAGLLNTAQVMAGKAIITAMILGLNSELQSNESEVQKEMARRIWWSLYSLDIQLSIELGRPFMIAPPQTTCRLPSDSPEIARLLGPHYMCEEGDIIWLSFQNHTLSLLNTVRTISSAFSNKCDSALRESNTNDFYTNGAIREECARFLKSQMKTLSAWANQLPAGFLIPRRDGKPLSTDRSPLDLNHDVPLYCQRQSLLIELQYHLYALILYRPFICFEQTPEISTPLSDTKAISSINHAIALTNMIHQALTSSELLSGINQVFRWQKDALFTMIGFMYAYPVSNHTMSTRKTIETAISVVKMYNGTLPEAGRIAIIARSLVEHADAMISGFRRGSWSTDLTNPGTASISSTESRPQTSDMTNNFSTSPTPPDKENLSGLVSMIQGPLEPAPGQGSGGPIDWADMDMLWNSFGSGAQDSETWMLSEEIFGFEGGEIEKSMD